MKKFLTVTLALVVASSGVAACGDGSDDEDNGKVDGPQVATTMEDGIEEQLGLEMQVSCPSPKQEKGKTFTCTATSSDDDEFDIEVTQKNDNGGVDWGLDILPTGPIEKSIASEIFSQRAIRVTLECPVAVPLEEDHDFQCTATDTKGATQTIYATVTDESGNVDWRA